MIAIARIPEPAMRRIELIIETIIFQTRWILAPFYLGLAFCMLLLLYHFGVQIFEFVVKIPHASETDVILGILTLIDVVFTANLVLIVVLSGYENFVSRIEADDHDRPDWMTKVDFGGLPRPQAQADDLDRGHLGDPAVAGIHEYRAVRQHQACMARRDPCRVPALDAGRGACRPPFGGWRGAGARPFQENIIRTAPGRHFIA
jgi:hypothetical protein